MGRYMDMLKKTVVNTTSPDGTVRVRLEASGMKPTLAPGACDRHDETSLAEQMGAAMTAARLGADTAVRLLAKKLDGRRRPEPDETDRVLDAKVATLESTAAFDRGQVTRQGAAEVIVKLRPRTVGYVTPDELLNQITDALSRADRQHTRRWLRMRRDVYLGDR